MAAYGSENGGIRVGARHVRGLLRCESVLARRVAPALLGALVVMHAATSVAQSPDRTRASWPERQVESPAGERRPGRITKPDEDSDVVDRRRSAAGILDDASDALQQGDVMLARRRLEVLIETYPETPAADIARERLASLFGERRDSGSARSVQNEPRGGQSGFLPPRTSKVAEPPPARRDGDTTGASAARPGLDDAVVRQRRQLQDERRVQVLGFEFQAAAGDRVFFAETSSELGARGRAVIAAQARWLGQHKDLPIVIEAHADDHRTNRERDTELSQKRAQAVAELLVEQGVGPDRIVVYAFGRDRPVATCQAPECAAQNRRVVVRVGSERDGSESRRGPEEPALATAPRRTLRNPGD